MKNKNKSRWKIVGYALIILFASVFLFIRIVRPMYRFKHSTTVVQDKNLQAENQK